VSLVSTRDLLLLLSAIPFPVFPNQFSVWRTLRRTSSALSAVDPSERHRDCQQFAAEATIALSTRLHSKFRTFSAPPIPPDLYHPTAGKAIPPTMSRHDQYILKVTAGATYDTSKHEDVHVNTEKPINISSEHLDARIQVRIKDYRGTSSHDRSTRLHSTTPRIALRHPTLLGRTL
jgi:hypothetical protein